MERTGACVVFLVFSVFSCSAETDSCAGRMPLVRLENNSMRCSVLAQHNIYSTGCHFVPTNNSMSCYVTYEGGVRCETPLNFNSCSVPLTTSHDFLLVEYGQRAELNCSIPNKPSSEYRLDWEISIKQTRDRTDTSVVWRTASLTDWDLNTNNIYCYLTEPDKAPCTKAVRLTLYKRPDSVNISSESDVRSEGQTMKLQCEIQNVAPVQNVTVQWIKIHQNEIQEPVKNMSIESFNFSGKPKANGTVKATLEVNASRADDGVKYQCAALLTLDQLQHPEVGRSHLLNITVHYKPTITQPSSGTVSLTKGDELSLNCSAHGNPSPWYVWTFPGNQNHTNSSILIQHIQPKHQGQYNCTAFNGEGFDSVTVEVTVVEDYLPIIASCVAVAVVLLVIAFCIWYCSYYRHTHMGHYILKNLTSRRHNANVAHSDVDQSEL